MLQDNNASGCCRTVLTALSLAIMWGGTAHAANQSTVVAEGDESTILLDLSAPASGDSHTLTNAGIVRESGPYWELGWPVVLTGAGEGQVFIENHGSILGRIDFSNLVGGLEFNNRGEWTFWNDPGDSVAFSAGDDVLHNEGVVNARDSGSFEFGAGDDVLSNSGIIDWSTVMLDFGDGDDLLENLAGGRMQFFGTRMDFGSGNNLIRNSGTIIAYNFIDAGFVRGAAVLENSGVFRIGSEMQFEDMQTLENSGNFVLLEGATVHFTDLVNLSNTGTVSLVGHQLMPATLQADRLQTFRNSGAILLSDGEWWSINVPTRDRIIAPGADFIAMEGSHIVLDAILDGGLQTKCLLQGAMQADCVNFAGGSTSGVTLVTIHGIPVEDGGAYSRLGTALIDVSGGVSHAGDFVLDPNSPGFDPVGLFGGGIRSGEFFTFNLVYDAPTQVHRLIGVPDAAFLPPGVLPAAAQDLWRLGNDVAAARLGELRHAKAGVQGGLWMKYGDSQAQRDAEVTAYALSMVDSVQTGYEQSSRALSFGADIVGGEGEQGYAVGISLGDVKSTVRIDGQATRAELSAMAINLYGSYRSGAFFLDLSGGGYAGDVEGTLVVGSAAKPLEGQARVFGIRTDAGWRLGFGERLALEPLLGVVYVRSALGDMERLQGSVLNALQFDAASSLRGGVGARAALDGELGGLKVGFSLGGRVWREFDGEAKAKFRTRVDAMPISSSFEGTFTDVTASLNVSTLGGALSGHAEVGGQFGNDYDAITASLGLRYNW